MNLANQALCRRCGHGMQQVAEIAPFGRKPGLVAYLCADCGATESTLLYPATTNHQQADHGQPKRHRQEH